MISINGLIVVYLTTPIPKVKIISKDERSFYKHLLWPVGKPLTPETVKVEVANQWEVNPSEVIILDNVEIPKI